MSSQPLNRSGEERASFYVPALDGLRAISFALVFLSHGGLSAYVPAGAGVSCFFFLSGFLITTLLEKEWRRSGTISIRSFYQRRALRILPPMYLVYAATLCLTITGLIPKPSARLTGGAVLAQVAYVTNYYLVPAGNEEHVPLGTQVLWSLAIEEHFYLLFPLAWLAMRRVLDNRVHAAVWLAACLSALLWRAVLVFHLHASQGRLFFGSDDRMDSILFGCILAMIANPLMGQRPGRRLMWCYWILWASVAAACLITGAGGRQVFGYSLESLSLVPCFVVALQQQQSAYVSWLASGPLVLVGKLSYTLYLCHFTILLTLKQVGGGRYSISTVALALAISLAVALLVYVAVDRPLAKMRRRLHKTLTPLRLEAIPALEDMRRSMKEEVL